MKVKIIESTSKDVSDFLSLEMKCFRYKVRFDKEQLTSRLGNLITHGISYKAVYKGHTIGHLTSFLTKTGDIFIDYLCVYPIHHDKQVGTQLLQKLQSDNPRKSIRLYTDQPNQKAMIFYIKRGFIIDDVVEGRVYFVRHD